MPNTLTPAQIRGARGMLDWSMVELAKAAKLSVSTVKRVEDGTQDPVSEETRFSIQAALEAAGVCFLHDMGEGIGIRISRH